MFFDHEVVPMTPHRLSFYCESSTEATFEFKVKKISAIMEPNLMKINEIARKQPFFIQKLNDYNSIDISDISDNENMKLNQN
jgi:uncharacterized membrane protein